MAYSLRGYLEEDWRLFRLKDTVSLSEIDWHYHSFHKLIFFRSGAAGYGIEGRHWPLEPGDIVLVPRGCVHRPEVGTGVPYGRDAVYISAAFAAEGGLDACFRRAGETGQYVLRLPEEARQPLFHLADALAEDAPEAFAAPLLGRLRMQELLIALTRAQLSGPLSPPAECNEKAAEILKYISDHLTEDVSADALAGHFYVSKYHLMRLFREETGHSIHRYVSGKRLLYARELLGQGLSPTESCFRCGYRDYSAFARAYKKQFGTSPKG